jgi:uncharacterized membrane protein
METGQIIWGSALLVLLVFAPGLAVTLALFPGLNQITWSERIGLSFVFGLIPQLILYFLTKNLSVPVTTTTSFLLVFLVIAAGLVVWKRRT